MPLGFGILQRRLVSSPRAIYQSLHRRSERLQKRLRELELLQRGAAAEVITPGTPALDADGGWEKPRLFPAPGLKSLCFPLDRHWFQSRHAETKTLRTRRTSVMNCLTCGVMLKMQILF